MSTVDTTSFLNTQRATSGSGATGFSSLSSEDFTKIILTELSKQDPLKPNDTSQLIEQISGIRSIQSDMDLSSKLEALIGQNEFSSAATLIGKRVSGLTEENRRMTGVVKTLAKTSEGPILTLADGTVLRLSKVDSIEQVTTGTPAPSTTTTTTSTGTPPATGGTTEPTEIDP